MVDVGLGKAGAVPLLGIFQPGARGADVVVLRKDSPKRRVDEEGFDVRRAVDRKIELFEKDDEVLGVPGNEHFIEGIAIDILAHAQKVGAIESPLQTIGLEIKAVAKTCESIFAFGQDEEEIPACFHLLVYRALPVGAFDSDGFQKFLGLITHGEVYADKPGQS